MGEFSAFTCLKELMPHVGVVKGATIRRSPCALSIQITQGWSTSPRKAANITRLKSWSPEHMYTKARSELTRSPHNGDVVQLSP